MEAPKKRKYSGPPKGSEEAKARMAKVREAQWAKNGLVSSGQRENGGPARDPSSNEPPRATR